MDLSFKKCSARSSTLSKCWSLVREKTKKVYNSSMLTIQLLSDPDTARRIGKFLTGSEAFDQTWAKNEKALVEQAPLDSLLHSNHRYWYVEDHGVIVAAMGVRQNELTSGGYQMDQDYLAVHREYRRKGLASRLMNQVIQYVRDQGGRYIHVVSSDIDSYAPARSFYEKFGFVKAGTMPNYYELGDGRVDYYLEFQPT